jgi:WD repeat-containing protein 45
MLACTSDKFTLHVFDVPKVGQQSGTAKADGQSESEAQGKYGFLSKIPLLPRVFSDRGSFASARFENGDETLITGLPPISEYTTLGTSRPEKGVLGWLDDSTVLVVSAGRDPRWERFLIFVEEGGTRSIKREGWKRYIGGS